MAKRNPNNMVEEINSKKGNFSISDILNNKSSSYTREQFIKDLSKLRAQYKGRQKELEKFNKEVSQTLGLGDTPNEKLIQNTKLEESKYYKTRMTMKLDDKTPNLQLLNLWNSLSSTMFSQGDKDDSSVLAGEGGIYHQQAKFLNMFLKDDEQIKTNKTYLSRNTNKGIRQDILQGYKKIQSQLNNPLDIRFIKDFWEAYEQFKTHLSSKVNLEYTDTEEGRRLLKNFSQAYLASGFNKDKVIETMNQDDFNITKLDDIEKLKEAIEKTKGITQQTDKTQEDINNRIEQDKTSNTLIQTDEQKRIKELEQQLEEQRRMNQSLEARLKQLESLVLNSVVKTNDNPFSSMESMISDFETKPFIDEKSHPEIEKPKTKKKSSGRRKKKTESEGWDFNW